MAIIARRHITQWLRLIDTSYNDSLDLWEWQWELEEVEISTYQVNFITYYDTAYLSLDTISVSSKYQYSAYEEKFPLPLSQSFISEEQTIMQAPIKSAAWDNRFSVTIEEFSESDEPGLWDAYYSYRGHTFVEGIGTTNSSWYLKWVADFNTCLLCYQTQSDTIGQCLEPNDLVSIPAELIEEYSLSVFPNPSKGDVTFSWENGLHSKQIQIRIYTLNGQFISAAESPGSNGQIQITLPEQPGMYLYEIKSDDQTLTWGKAVRE